MDGSSSLNGGSGCGEHALLDGAVIHSGGGNVSQIFAKDVCVYPSSIPTESLEVSRPKEGNNIKQVRVNPIPSIKVLADTSRIKAGSLHNHTKYSVKPAPSNKTASIFYSNVSSFSKHAMEYVFALPSEVLILMLCEMHKDKNFVENKFEQHGFSASYTVPENTVAGNHGGEVVALRSSYESREISQDTINNLEHLGRLRFAHKIVSFQSVEVLFICVYLWHTEGLSERNNNILKQTYLMKSILKLPILCMGDFNLTYDEFLSSGWPQKLRVKMINPPVETTTSASRNRKIDFGFVSIEIEMM